MCEKCVQYTIKTHIFSTPKKRIFSVFMCFSFIFKRNGCRLWCVTSCNIAMILKGNARTITKIISLSRARDLWWSNFVNNFMWMYSQSASRLNVERKRERFSSGKCSGTRAFIVFGVLLLFTRTTVFCVHVHVHSVKCYFRDSGIGLPLYGCMFKNNQNSVKQNEWKRRKSNEMQKKKRKIKQKKN